MVAIDFFFFAMSQQGFHGYLIFFWLHQSGISDITMSFAMVDDKAWSVNNATTQVSRVTRA